MQGMLLGPKQFTIKVIVYKVMNFAEFLQTTFRAVMHTGNKLQFCASLKSVVIALWSELTRGFAGVGVKKGCRQGLPADFLFRCLVATDASQSPRSVTLV
ncbi:MAG: hypothetical protein CM15mP68_6240 [Pseudomonadota bacterium]|nr:MAG: hypothetical protein CM15mP68_6240 [Pseudomonadota bacterium]